MGEVLRAAWLGEVVSMGYERRRKKVLRGRPKRRRTRTGDRAFCTHATPCQALALGWPGLYINRTAEMNKLIDQETMSLVQRGAGTYTCPLIERVYVRRSLEPLHCLSRFILPCWSTFPLHLGLGAGSHGSALSRAAPGRNRVRSRASPNKEGRRNNGSCHAGRAVRQPGARRRP